VELKFYNWESWKQAVFGIQIHSIIIPFGIMVISTILFAIFFEITPELAASNRKKLEEMQML